MRYSKEQKGLLDSQHYKEFLEKRGLKTAIINKTLTFKNINDIVKDDIDTQ